MRYNDMKTIRRRHLGRYLFELNRFYQKDTIAYIQSKGFPEFTAGYLQFISQIDLESGTEMKTLTKRMNTSKQLVSRTLKTCERLGYVVLQSSKDDKRALVVKFDTRGKALMKIALKAIENTEEKFKQELGQHKFQLLKDLLDEVSSKFEIIRVDSV